MMVVVILGHAPTKYQLADHFYIIALISISDKIQKLKTIKCGQIALNTHKQQMCAANVLHA